MSNPLYRAKLLGKEADDIASSLLKDDALEVDSNAQPGRRQSRIASPESYVILPGKVHGGYSYPELLVPFDRSHQGQNWEQTQQSVRNEDGIILTIRQYADFLAHIKSGNQVYDGKRRRVNKLRLDVLIDDILTVKDPYRAEWLDAKFKKRSMSIVSSKNTITYHKIKSDGTIEEVTEDLQGCLMKDKTQGIDLGSWLQNATIQGLPAKKVPSGSLYYWSPRENTVAGFGADSVWVDLYCGWNPQFSVAGLGVRVAKINGGVQK